MARIKLEDIDLRYKDDLSEKDQNILRHELISLRRRDPNALQQRGNTVLLHVKRLQKLGWSVKSIEHVTGASRGLQRTWRKGVQAVQQTPTPRPAREIVDLRKRNRKKQKAKVPLRLPLLETKLPIEVLDVICEYLPLKNVLALRQTSKTMATAAMRHIGSEIALISRRDSFRALVEISKHHEISKQVRSLFYMCDRLNFDALKFEKAWPGRATIPERPSYELESLDVLFRECRRLREITVASAKGCTRRLNAFRKAVLRLDYSNLSVDEEERDFNGSLDWKYAAGVRQVLNIANAVAYAGLKIYSLTISETTHRLWDRHSEMDWKNLQALVRPLRRLRLSVGATRIREDDSDLFDLFGIDYHMKNYRAGRFRAMLTGATNLRVLKMQFPPFPLDYGSFESPDLNNLLGDLHFPQLYELAISRCAMLLTHLT